MPHFWFFTDTIIMSSWFFLDLQLISFFYTKLKFQTEGQINKRALPKNNMNFFRLFGGQSGFFQIVWQTIWITIWFLSDCLANNLNFFRLLCERVKNKHYLKTHANGGHFKRLLLIILIDSFMLVLDAMVFWPCTSCVASVLSTL